MGRTIGSSNQKKSKVLLFQEQEKSWVVATLKDKKPGTIGQIFELSYELGTVPVGISSGEKDARGRVIYNEATVVPGEEVTLFGNTQLDDKIGTQVNVGERVLVLYKGKGTSPKTKRQFNDYLVRVLDLNEDHTQYVQPAVKA